MKMGLSWKAPAEWIKIQTVDAHTAGEPLRIVTHGFPPVPGKTILEKRKYVRQNLDHLRTLLIGEPRGHADMYGCILTEPETRDGDFGVIFLHNEGYSTMCGHGIIALTRVVLETWEAAGHSASPVLKIDTPAGRVVARAKRKNGRIKAISFENVPSYAALMDRTVEVEGLGRIKFDLAYGGAYYAFCSARDLGFRLLPDESRDIIEAGKKIKRAVHSTYPVIHPAAKDLGFLYGVIFVGPPHDDHNHSRNVCVFADGELDRSPTGTGVSARAAIHYERHELDVGEPFTVESIVGTCFTARVKETTRLGDNPAVIPEVSGMAHITGCHMFVIDPEDPLKNGFFIRS
jgi:trans-L-3-hydroxyproline dehydratase